jgi:predicted transcriptional regulator
MKKEYTLMLDYDNETVKIFKNKLKINEEQYLLIENFFNKVFINNGMVCNEFKYSENNDITKTKIINGLNKKITEYNNRFDILISEKLFINNQLLAEVKHYLTKKGNDAYEYYFYEETLNKYNLFDIK